MENLVCSGVLEILLSRYSVDRMRCELRELKKGGVGSYYRQTSLHSLKRNKASRRTTLLCDILINLSVMIPENMKRGLKSTN